MARVLRELRTGDPAPHPAERGRRRREALHERCHQGRVRPALPGQLPAGPAGDGAAPRRHGRRRRRRPGVRPHQRLPRARSPPRRSQPARGAPAGERGARPLRLRPERAGPGPHLPDDQRRGPAAAHHPARDHRPPAHHLLRFDRRGGHADRVAGAAHVAARAFRVDARPPHAGPDPGASHPHQADRRRDLRAVPRPQLRRGEALQRGGRREPHRHAGRPHRRGRRPQRGRDRLRHGPPRPPQRARQHPRQEGPRDLRRVRRQGAGALPRRRRREVPPRLLQRRHHRLRQVCAPDDVLQPQPPGVGGPGGRGPRPRQARIAARAS